MTLDTARVRGRGFVRNTEDGPVMDGEGQEAGSLSG